MFCSECGQQNADDNKFCMKCGKKLVTEQTVSSLSEATVKPVTFVSKEGDQTNSSPSVDSKVHVSTELKESGTVTAMSVIGLVFGLIGMLGSFIPCLGSFAFYIALPAAIASGIALGIAYSQNAKRTFAIVALTISLIGVVISGWQLYSIASVGQSIISESRRIGESGSAKKEPPQPAAPAAPSAPAAAAPAAPAADGRAVFEAKCGVCHPLDRTTVRQETRDTWVSIVKDMQGRKSGWISDAEAAKIVEFLTAEYGKPSAASQREVVPPVEKRINGPVPVTVKEKWKAAKIEVEYKDNKIKKQYIVEISSEFNVPDSDLRLKVGPFLPHFTMGADGITSASDNLENPALQIKVFQGGEEIYSGWIYSKHPAVHPFQTDKYGLVLLDGIRR